MEFEWGLELKSNPASVLIGFLVVTLAHSPLLGMTGHLVHCLLSHSWGEEFFVLWSAHSCFLSIIKEKQYYNVHRTIICFLQAK